MSGTTAQQAALAALALQLLQATSAPQAAQPEPETLTWDSIYEALDKRATSSKLAIVTQKLDQAAEGKARFVALLESAIVFIGPTEKYPDNRFYLSIWSPLIKKIPSENLKTLTELNKWAFDAPGMVVLRDESVSLQMRLPVEGLTPEYVATCVEHALIWCAQNDDFLIEKFGGTTWMGAREKARESGASAADL
jgi:hypothetical protein